MQALQQVMGLIDTHSNVMPEGDYLKMCGLMKVMFDEMSKKASRPESRVPFCPIRASRNLDERYRRNNRAIYVNSSDIRKYSVEYRKLKLRSRVTASVKVEAGSDDNDVCKSFLKQANFEVLRRRNVLQDKLSELECVKELLEDARRLIKIERDREIASIADRLVG